MDLPPPSQQDNTTPPLSSGSTSASSSMTSLDKQTCEEAEDESETLGDHFAKQNQSTLKKNEKFQDVSLRRNDKIGNENRVSAKIEEIVLRIEEGNEKSDPNRLSVVGAIRERDPSPIPVRNTQKFVSQFADLKLTGGCSAIPGRPMSTGAIKEPEKSDNSVKEKPNFVFGSFKPPISVKPENLKKKSIFLQGQSSNASSDTENGQN